MFVAVLLAAATAPAPTQQAGKIPLTAAICESDQQRKRFFAQPGGPPRLTSSPDILARKQRFERRLALLQQRAKANGSGQSDLYLQLLKTPAVTAAGRAMVAFGNEISDRSRVARQTGDERKMCLAALEQFERLPELEALQRQFIAVEERELDALAGRLKVSLQP